MYDVNDCINQSGIPGSGDYAILHGLVHPGGLVWHLIAAAGLVLLALPSKPQSPQVYSCSALH